MFGAALCTTAKHQKQPKHTSKGARLCNVVHPYLLWYTHQTEYCSATERHELLLYATIGLNVKIITLNEKSQSQNWILYDSIYIQFRNYKITYYDINQFGTSLRLGMEGENKVLQKGTSGLLGDEKCSVS